MKIDVAKFEVPDSAAVESLRRMTPDQRLAIANEMWVSARNAIRRKLAEEHPDWDEAKVAREAARMMLLRSLMDDSHPPSERELTEIWKAVLACDEQS